MLDIRTLTVGEMETNCYLVSSSDGGAKGDSSEVETKCLIIDPGDDADFITQTILDNKLKPIAIVLTHGHFDHVLGCLELKLNFNIPIYLHEKDAKLYASANQSAAHWLKKKSLKVPSVDQYIKEGDKIPFGNEFLTVIETPGHTPGSICLYSSPLNLKSQMSNVKYLFTGDTLFAEGVGRTNFSYSSPSDLQKSLRKISNLQYQISNFKSQIVIYPGHGESTIL